MKTILSILVGSPILIAALASSASAQDARTLYYAADQYREAVVHFEEEARRVPTLDRFALRLIDRLEDQTSDLRSSSRRVSDLSRLLYEFNEIESLQARVENAVFGSGCPIIQAALGSCWNEVLVAYSSLALEIQALQRPAYQTGYRGRPNCEHPLASTRGQGFLPSAPFGPTPRVSAPRVPAPFAPHSSYRVPTRNPRYDRFQPVPPNVGSLIVGGLLSRLSRGL